jgi:hypothetical protein
VAFSERFLGRHNGFRLANKYLWAAKRKTLGGANYATIAFQWTNPVPDPTSLDCLCGLGGGSGSGVGPKYWNWHVPADGGK